MPIEASFFARDALEVARDLVGMILVHRVAHHAEKGDLRIARVVETEAYRGRGDAACHARFGETARTRSLFSHPGTSYVFLVYGMHDCFNVVAMAEGEGHAVLVRAVEPVAGFAEGARGDGPGRLTRAMGITRRHDGIDLTRPAPTSALFFARPRGPVGKLVVATSARVGVAYAGEIADAPYRFYDAASPHVSRPPKKLIGRGLPAVAAPAVAVPPPRAKKKDARGR